HCGRGVMSVSAFAGRREARDENVRLKTADVPDDVGEDRVVSPYLERFFRRLRVAEVESAREVLFAAVDASRCEQLLRANHTEQFALLVSEQVLSAVAARHREVSGAIEPVVRKP